MGGRIELDSQNGWTLFTLVLAADAASRRSSAWSRFEQLEHVKTDAVFTCNASAGRVSV